MKLTGKIVAIFMLGVVVLTAIHGYLTVRREDQQLKKDMEQEAHSIARAMEETVVVLWRERGHRGVIQLVTSADRRHKHMTIRWLGLDVGYDTQPSAAPLERLRAAPGGSVLSFTSLDELGRERRLMYFPIDVENKRAGCLEFSEPLAHVDRYTRGTIYQTAVAITGMLLCGILVALLGIRMVGRPLERLIEKTKRIGQGDFSKQLELKGRDELSQLADALNQMSDQLAAQQEKIRSESSARVAAVEQLRHVDRLKTVGRLASGIAHELGTPLNVVSGRAELIASGRLDESQTRESAHAIKSEADRMATIIRQLLDFARRRSPQRAAVDLRDLADQCVELLHAIAEKRNVVLTLDGGSERMIANVDAAQIQQVLTNLIVNAIQAMPNGGNATITLRAEQARAPEDHDAPPGMYYCISVRDEGEGINGEDMLHLFEPFFTTKELGEGTGLGLSVSHGIIQDHDGWIDVESEPGGGSCFTVYLAQGNQ